MRSRSAKVALPRPGGDGGRGKGLQALVGAGMVVMLDNGCDLLLQGAGPGVGREQDPVLQPLVPALVHGAYAAHGGHGPPHGLGSAGARERHGCGSCLGPRAIRPGH